MRIRKTTCDHLIVKAWWKVVRDRIARLKVMSRLACWDVCGLAESGKKLPKWILAQDSIPSSLFS